MEVHTTETTENEALQPITSTETAETLDQSAPPVIDHPHKTETLEQSPPPLDQSAPPAETSLSPVASTQTTEELEQTAVTRLAEATSTHEAEQSEESTLPPVINTQTTETLEQSTVSILEDTKATETMKQSVMASDLVDNSHDTLTVSFENHQDMGMRQETAEEEEEIRNVLKVIAATGKFWYDWEKLRSMLSLHLKQVISEYPQAKMSIEEQKISLGETHAELVKRLDDALHSFIDGPPFTLQRLSEIILDAQSLYPNLSKLALALEKNLSVTSTLTISTDHPYPPSLITTPNGLNKVTEGPNPNPISQVQSDTIMENGAQPVTADRDEVMMEVEADVGDVMTMDVETNEKSSDTSPMATDIVGSSGVLVQPTGLSRL